MRTLGDETRLRILRALREADLCVCDLATGLGIRQPLVSHHLKALKAAGLVRCRKDGQWTHYALRAETFAAWGLGALLADGAVLGRQPVSPAGPAAPGPVPPGPPPEPRAG